jgi:hypothetical protein
MKTVILAWIPQSCGDVNQPYSSDPFEGIEVLAILENGPVSTDKCQSITDPIQKNYPGSKFHIEEVPA